MVKKKKKRYKVYPTLYKVEFSSLSLSKGLHAYEYFDPPVYYVTAKDELDAWIQVDKWLRTNATS